MNEKMKSFDLITMQNQLKTTITLQQQQQKPLSLSYQEYRRSERWSSMEVLFLNCICLNFLD